MIYQISQAFDYLDNDHIDASRQIMDCRRRLKDIIYLEICDTAIPLSMRQEDDHHWFRAGAHSKWHHSLEG